LWQTILMMKLWIGIFCFGTTPQISRRNSRFDNQKAWFWGGIMKTSYSFVASESKMDIPLFFNIELSNWIESFIFWTGLFLNRLVERERERELIIISNFPFFFFSYGKILLFAFGCWQKLSNGIMLCLSSFYEINSSTKKLKVNPFILWRNLINPCFWWSSKELLLYLTDETQCVWFDNQLFER